MSNNANKLNQDIQSCELDTFNPKIAHLTCVTWVNFFSKCEAVVEYVLKRVGQ